MLHIRERTLADLGSASRGRTLVVVSGIHGNEPAGVQAAHRVAGELEPLAARLRGRAVFLVGNLSALRAGLRYVDRDLNRAWTRAGVAALRNGGPPAGEWHSEDREQLELLQELDEILDESIGSAVVLDLHTTSGDNGLFSTVADTLDNREVALALPVPLVLGLEELVDGTLHDYLATRGCATLAFESGQHREPRAEERARAAIWIILEAIGLLPESENRELAASRKLLSRAGRRLPRVLEMRYRHPVVPGDGFHMRPGYKNFQSVERGEVLAGDRTGPLRAPEAARVLMPLYQVQGSDGFFVVREFSPLWLKVSRALRMSGLARIVHWLPGIRRHPEQEAAFVVDRRVARWYALQVLHLLGFKRDRTEGEMLYVRRRSHELP